MLELKDNSLFTELTSEESASVNGACYCHPRRHRRRYVVYRRNCDGTYRRVVRYY